MPRILAFVALALVMISPVYAQEGMIKRYYDALKMDEVFDILSQEGIDGAMVLTEDGTLSPSVAWTKRVEAIYAINRMDGMMRHGMVSVGNLEASEQALAFFESDLGRRIIDIELEARRVIGDEQVENALREKAGEMSRDQADRIALYQDFIDANGLIDNNVSGALNANLAFYQGMASVPQNQDAMPEQFMLSMVWEQEPEIRADMVDWTMNFSVLAYEGLSGEEMQKYIDISNTAAGKKLNAVLFAGFDELFKMQSFELGRATAEFMVGDDT